jgi:hypothetical protein
LKKDAAHFFNPDFVGTEEKEAAYAVAGVNSKKCMLEFTIYGIDLIRQQRPQKNSVKKFTE